MAQFGVATDAADSKYWAERAIPDDVDLHIPISRGIISFAGNGPETRDTQLFMPFTFLDSVGRNPWERPIGYVVDGLDALLSSDGTEQGHGEEYGYFEHCQVLTMRENWTSVTDTAHLSHKDHHAMALEMSPPPPKSSFGASTSVEPGGPNIHGPSKSIITSPPHSHRFSAAILFLALSCVCAALLRSRRFVRLLPSYQPGNMKFV